ncbi:hypothetical protein CMK11_06145 [Candidatus Poribacteria bacterium]|nr:hypothetical protein [Candidatus Poribacteria bacterium]
MDTEFLAFFTVLFLIENGIFALVGIATLVHAFQNSRRREREQREADALAKAEATPSLHDQVAKTQEMIADLLLHLNEERGVTSRSRASRDGREPTALGDSNDGHR